MDLNSTTYQRVLEVFNKIKHFPYGIVTLSGKVLYDSDNYEDMITITPKEYITKYKAGTCIDTVEYMYSVLKDLPCKKLYFETEKGEAHTILIIQDVESHKLLVPEVSWKKYQKIYTFNTIPQILKVVENNMVQYFHRKGCGIVDYTNVVMKYHLNYIQFWELMWTKGKILKVIKREYDDGDIRKRSNYRFRL